jgi:hypothetical protein
MKMTRSRNKEERSNGADQEDHRNHIHLASQLPAGSDTNASALCEPILHCSHVCAACLAAAIVSVTPDPRGGQAEVESFGN